MHFRIGGALAVAVTCVSIGAAIRCGASSTRNRPSTPSSSAAAPATTPAPAAVNDVERSGRALVENAVTAMGGADAVDGIRTLELKGNARRIFPGGQETKFESTTTILFPAAIRQDLDLAFGRLTTVWTSQGAFTDMGNGPVLLPDLQRAELEAGFRRNLIILLQSRKQPDFHAFDRGAVSVGSAAAEEVEVHSAGQETTLAIDRATGRILRMRSVSPMEARSGKRETVTEFSDYRPVDRIHYPFSATSALGGEPAAAVELQSVKVNLPVEPSFFEPSVAPVSPDAPSEGAAPPSAEHAMPPPPSPTPSAR